MPKWGWELVAAAAIGAATVAVKRWFADGYAMDWFGPDAKETFALGAGGFLASRWITRAVPKV